MTERIARTGQLYIAFDDIGPADGLPVILLHGFPYAADAYGEVGEILAAAGRRVIIPSLRGYGATKFVSDTTLRSGEQAAVGHDLLDLMNVLNIEKAVLGGFDWGGRAAAIVAALWPERVTGLVSCGGYPILDVAAAGRPVTPEQEHRFWYQHYFLTERGRRGLAENKAEMTRLLWRLWSPQWNFDDQTLARTLDALANADFVDVAIHSYRHRMGCAAGDPRYAATERLLAAKPRIATPTIVLHGAADGVNPCETSAAHARFFTGPYERRVLPKVGHNPPQEAPRDFADALLSLYHSR